MPNWKSFLAELEDLSDADREWIIRHYTRQAERGFSIPTGKEVQDRLKEYLKGVQTKDET